MPRSLRVLALAAALFVSGCGARSAGTAPSPLPSLSGSAYPVSVVRIPVEIVRDSFVRASSAKTYTMTVHIDAGPESIDMLAKVDLANDAMWMSMEAGETTESIKIGNDVFIKAPGLGEKPFLRIRRDKLDADSPLRGSLETLNNQSGVLAGVITAQRTGSDGEAVIYAGFTDLNVAAVHAEGTVRESLEQMARVRRNVPYTATVDRQGRLLELSYTVNAAGQRLTTDILMTDLGEPVTIERPAAAEVADATEEQYSLL